MGNIISIIQMVPTSKLGSFIGRLMDHPMVQLVLSNQLFVGIVGPIFMSKLWNILTFIVQHMKDRVKMSCLCELVIEKKDTSYNYIIDYVTQYEKKSRMKGVLVNTTSFRETRVVESHEIEYGPSRRLRFVDNSIGFMRVMWHNNIPLFIQWTDTAITVRGWKGTMKSIKEYVLGIIQNTQKQASRNPGLYCPHHDFSFNKSSWKLKCEIPVVSTEKLILDPDMSTSICEDFEHFMNNKTWYLDRHIPYRRGYLLSGLPGTGKTSLIQFLATKYQYHLCLMDLDTIMTNDVGEYFNTLPSHSIIVIEDMDRYFQPFFKPSKVVDVSNIQDVRLREAAKGNGNIVDLDGTPYLFNTRTCLSLSSLLNAIEGIETKEDRFLIITTNHIERLDPALIRPGRCDKVFNFGYATEYQIKKLTHRIYQDELETKRETLIEKLIGLQITVATLQGYLIENVSNIDNAIDNVSSLGSLE